MYYFWSVFMHPIRFNVTGAYCFHPVHPSVRSSLRTSANSHLFSRRRSKKLHTGILTSCPWSNQKVVSKFANMDLVSVCYMNPIRTPLYHASSPIFVKDSLQDYETSEVHSLYHALDQDRSWYHSLQILSQFSTMDLVSAACYLLWTQLYHANSPILFQEGMLAVPSNFAGGFLASCPWDLNLVLRYGNLLKNFTGHGHKMLSLTQFSSSYTEHNYIESPTYPTHAQLLVNELLLHDLLSQCIYSLTSI